MGSRVARDVAVVVLLHVVVAVAIGLLVPHLADLPRLVRTTDGLSTSEVEVAKHFNDDGWLVVLSGLAGLVLGIALQRWRATHDVVTLLAVTAAALLAAPLAGWVAEATGPADPAVVLAEARRGASAESAVVIDSRAAYLVWALAAVLGALAVLVATPSGPAPRTGASGGALPERR